MGLNCVRGIVEKFGEKIVSETLDIQESYFERATNTGQLMGLCKSIYNMVYAAPMKILNDLRGRFLQIMDPYLSDREQSIRELAGAVFVMIFSKTYEPVFITHNIEKSFLKKLH